MKICPAFYIIVWIWIKLGKKCPKKKSTDCEFHENWRSEKLRVFVGTVELTWLELVQAICASCLLSSICKFPENRYSEGRTFFYGHN
jgi:hypothetical protein